MIKGLLDAEGVPALVRTQRGFEIPELVVAGPRDILVRADQYVAARQILYGAPLEGAPPPPSEAAPDPRYPMRLAVGLILALILLALILATIDIP